MMCAIYKVMGLFEVVTREEVERMAPTTRLKFAQLCRHWAAVAEQPPAKAASRTPGILADLRGGERGH